VTVHIVHYVRGQVDTVSRGRWTRYLPWGLATVAVLAAGLAMSGRLVTEPAGQASHDLRKFDFALDLAPASQFVATPYANAARLAPDGRRMAYHAGNHLWIRDLDNTTPHDLGEMPQRSFGVAWSPDSQSVAFASDDMKL